MENALHALYQFFGAALFIMALTLFYSMDVQLNQTLDYRMEHIHNQKALEYMEIDE